MFKPNEVLQQLNRSGFPFQLKVEALIRETQSQHQWTVLGHEQAWKHPETGATGFVDIALKHASSVCEIAIECKRMRAEDARQLRWLFLLPDTELNATRRASCLEIEAGVLQDQGWRDVRVWDEVAVSPSSLESEFCILPNDEQRRQPILESLATEMLESAEGLAHEQVTVSQARREPLRSFIFPMIVTNAELVACRFSANDISPKDGTLDLSKVSLEVVPFIRFRKSLVQPISTGLFRVPVGAQRAGERTVFVVNAEAISDLLAAWDVKPGGWGSYASLRYFKSAD